jgi:hypothetical protein
MAELSYRRRRFPPVVIQQAVWLYLRFTLSYRDIEDLLAERGLDISYERNRAELGAEVRTGDRPAVTAAPSAPERSMAPGRDGGSDRRRANGGAEMNVNQANLHISEPVWTHERAASPRSIRDQLCDPPYTVHSSPPNDRSVQRPHARHRILRPPTRPLVARLKSSDPVVMGKG